MLSHVRQGVSTNQTCTLSRETHFLFNICTLHCIDLFLITVTSNIEGYFINGGSFQPVKEENKMKIKDPVSHYNEKLSKY